VIDRSTAAKLGAQTVRLVEQGCYENARGERVPLADHVAACVAGTELIRPADWNAIEKRAASLAARDTVAGRTAVVEVTLETTLAAARRLRERADDVLALNFASAKNPGGGFLGGSRAQEESLARSSALYASLLAQPVYYEANRAGPRAVYTDHAIYSPRVPVFRDDTGTLLDAPYDVSFVTMPAVNVSAMRQHGRLDQDVIGRTMERRIHCVLALAAARDHRVLVLGAWGCGVFGNDSHLIAGIFAETLGAGIGACFDHVTFAVFDPSPDQAKYAAFRERLTAAAR
jgi:uncharacterized protein (TIGR02452 family)